MDLARAYEQLLAGSPLAIGAALVAIAWSTRRSVLAAVRRFGVRLGRLEQGRAADLEAARMERARRWQLEAALIAAGFAIPPWPDLPDDVPAPVPRHATPDWSPSR